MKMCMNEEAARQLREYLERLRQSRLNGNVPDADMLIESACDDFQPEHGEVATKTTIDKVDAFLRGASEVNPGMFKSRNARTRAARKAAKHGESSILGSVKLNELRKIIKEIFGDQE